MSLEFLKLEHNFLRFHSLKKKIETIFVKHSGMALCYMPNLRGHILSGAEWAL